MATTTSGTKQKRLAFFALVIIVLWQMEEFQAITIPFTMLATWMHEMLHALMAILVGFHFKYLSISLNGSGYALYYDPHKHHDEQQQDDIHPCDVKHAMIAMAGSFGPPCFGFLFFILSTRGKKVMQVALVLFASMILLSMYWIRGKETSELAYILLFGIATLLIWLACKAPQAAHLQTCLQFLAIQACIAVFEDVECTCIDTCFFHNIFRFV